MDVSFSGAVIEKLIDTLELKSIWVTISFLCLFLYKSYKERLESSHAKKTETLSKLIEYLESNSNNFFIKEMLFENHFRKSISSYEIDFFLRSKKPSNYLYRFLNGKRYLSVTQNSRAIGYKKSKKPVAAKWGYSVWYYLFGVLGVLMLFVSPIALSNATPQLIISWSIVNTCLFAMAVIGLYEAVSADIAIGLIEEINAPT